MSSYAEEAARLAGLGGIEQGQILATLALAESLGEITAELYRIRVAVEVLAGEALDREAAAGIAPGELTYRGRLGPGVEKAAADALRRAGVDVASRTWRDETGTGS